MSLCKLSLRGLGQTIKFMQVLEICTNFEIKLF